MVGLLEEPLDGRLLTHEGDDDFAVPGAVLGTDDDVVALEDPRIDHRLAANAQDVLPVLAAGGLLIALGFLFGGYDITTDGQTIAVDKPSSKKPKAAPCSQLKRVMNWV